MRYYPPAHYVIYIFGGVRATARLLGMTPPAISKWKKPESELGRGGRVPGKAQLKILKIAKAKGLDIQAADLILGREV